MTENHRGKYELTELFTRQSYLIARPPRLPNNIHYFLGYRKRIIVIFQRYHGYEVSASARGLYDHISINDGLGSVRMAIAAIHLPLICNMAHVVYMAGNSGKHITYKNKND